LKQAIESADPKVTLAVANSLWANREIEFSRAFIERNERFFAAEVQALDFMSPDAAQTINAWVSRQTRDKIPTIVDEVPQDAILYLINAVYFYGQWSEQFDKQDTMPADFKLLDGTTVQRPQMRQHGEYAYLENERFQAAALPYGDGAFSMLIILPLQDDGLAGLQADLNAETWQGWISELRTAEGSILLPRFKVEYANELSDELKALGMGAAFDKQRADFKAMLADPRPGQVVYISLVKHKTFIEVNEQGTEAAAVTSVEIKMTTAMPNEPAPFLLRVDHPFLFAIVHEQSGALLFLGSIVDPTE